MRTSTLLAAAVVGMSSLASAAIVDLSQYIAHNGTPQGVIQKVDGVDFYIAKPKLCDAVSKNTAVVYITDVFGIQLLENKLLADSFARAGYLTVAPDLFNGTPAPADLNSPGFNSSAFLAAHGPDVADPIVSKAITYLRERLGFTKVAATGYCYGGRYAFRFVAPGKGADVAFAAHPSAWLESEIAAIKGATSVAEGDLDTANPPAQRSRMEALLLNTSTPYQVSLYSGAPHGFGVRANISDPQQKFAKESAFLQAVHWFDTWAA